MSLNLKKNGGGYRVRVFGPYLGVGPALLSVVGTESEEQVALLAETYPDSIYFVTEEALA